MEVGEREIIYLSLHCHHQNDFCIKMGSDESHFDLSVGSDGQSHKTVSIKPVLNWANVCSRTWLEVFGEPSWFLIGRTFLREPSSKYSSKLYSGSKKLRSTCSGNIRPIRRILPLIG